MNEIGRVGSMENSGEGRMEIGRGVRMKNSGA